MKRIILTDGTFGCFSVIIIVLILALQGCVTDETITTSKGNTYKKVYTQDSRGRSEWTSIEKVEE